MDANKLQYWNNRLAVKYSQINKQILPWLNDVEDYTIHIDPEAKDEMRQKIDAVHAAMKDLAKTIDARISKKARNLITQ